MEGSHTSWSHDASETAEQETYNRGSGEERIGGRRESLVGCLIPTPVQIFTQLLPPLKFNPLSWPDEASDEAVCFNQTLRRQKPKRAEQRLVFVSCGGNESVGTAHRQTGGWGGGPCDVRPGTRQD